nr:15-hydroxyprostaglandin dehydrogenase [NAD(+)] isoform X2 [Halyomorpha halys]
MDLNGKVALITGGAQGIGRAYCNSLVNEGVKVAICDINEAEGLSLEKHLNSKEKRSIFIYCDVTKNSQFEESFRKVISEFGQLDIVVNNAGILSDHPQLWEKEVEVNLCGTIRGTLLGLRYLKQGGAIVATSSLAGILKDSAFPIYAATKGGVNYFVRSLGSSVTAAAKGIRILAIAPSLTDTPITQQLVGNCTITPELQLIAQKRSEEMYKQKCATMQVKQRYTRLTGQTENMN